MSSTNTKENSATMLLFHKFIEKKIRELKFGTLTVNLVLKDGQILIETVTTVQQRRKKYKLKPLTENR